jgi:molybdenum-dependent DNA-binding transcriptional regulator ModE
MDYEVFWISQINRKSSVPLRQSARRWKQGGGALNAQGQQLLAHDRQRRTKLKEHFAAARGHLAAGNRDDAIRTLRAIQESVVYFRDILKHVAV